MVCNVELGAKFLFVAEDEEGRYPRITEPGHALARKGPERSHCCKPRVLWLGTPGTRVACPELRPAWPRPLSGLGHAQLLWATCSRTVFFLNPSSKPALFQFGSIPPCAVPACPCTKSLSSFLVGCRQVLEGPSWVKPKPKSLFQAEEAQLSQAFLAGELFQPSQHLGVPPGHLLQCVPVLASRAGEPSRAGRGTAGAVSVAWRGRITVLHLLAMLVLMQPRIWLANSRHLLGIFLQSCAPVPSTLSGMCL